MYLASQIISLIGMFFGVLAFQCKKHSHIMFFKIIHEFLSAIHYLLLGAYTGMIMNLLGCVRNGTFSILVSKNKKTASAVAVFGILFLVLGVFTWQGPKSLLVIGAKILSCIAYGCKNTATVRKLALLTNSGWFIYNIVIFSVSAFLCDGLMILSTLIGILRHDLLPWWQKKRGSHA